MYVVHVVQAGAGLPLRQHPARQQNRSVSAEAGNGPSLSHGVLLQPAYDAPPQAAAAASDALSCQPTRTAVVPWLRQIAVLMRSPERLPPSVITRCSPQEGSSIGVLTATSPTSTSTSTAVAWGEGPDPLTIHLPGADGTAESSPADPASGGLPNTPTVVSSNSNSLALKQQAAAAVQRRQSGELGFRPGSGGSRTLPTMLQRGANSSNALQARPSTAVPASAPAGSSTSLQPKLPGPLGLLPALQWGGSGTFWGSPIGGTLFINPSLNEPAAVTPSQQQQHQHGHNQQQQQLLTKSSGMQWGSPIGGTLFINPPVHELGASPASAWAPLEDTAAAAAATGATAARAAASTASSNNTLPGVGKAGSRTSKLPFLPPFKWGGGASSKAQWGALPIGGTLYINPEAPADWHEGPSWGSGSSGFGSSSGGGGGSGNGSSGGIAGGVRSRQAGSGYVPAGAAQASWAVPSGLRLAKLGVGLMAAIAAAAMAVYLKATPSASSTSSASRGNGAVEARSAAPAPSGGGAATAAAGSNGAAGAATAADATAEAAPAGVGFHQWMVQRLQSTLESFEAEQGLLKAELAALKGMAAAASSQQGVLGGFRRWLGGSGKGGGPAGDDASGVMSAAAATAAAVSGGVTSAGRVAGGPGGSGSSADVASRVAEVQEQLDSIAVLRAALAAELAEHQQMLRAAEQQQAASKERLAALAGR